MATTYFARSGGGNWNANGSWSTVASNSSTNTGTFPVAGDTATFDSGSTGTITVNVASATAVLNMTGSGGTLAFGSQTLTTTGAVTLAGAFTSTTGTLTCAGGVTLSATPTGSYPKLSLTASQTLTSAGFTWPGTMTFTSGTPIITLSGNWINTGLVTSSSAPVINLTTTETITCNGGLTATAGITGTATIILGGGTWQSSGVIKNNLTINCTTLTILSGVGYNTGTLTYTAGTVTTTGSTLNVGASTTFNTGTMSWGNIGLSDSFGVSSTTTLSSALIVGGTLSITASSNTYTFSGAFGITCGTLKLIPATNSSTFVYPAGQTITVTTGLQLTADLSQSNTWTFKSDTGSSYTNLTYNGTLANSKIAGIIFTDVDASASAVVLNNWYGGTLTRTKNINNVTSANIGGGGGGFFIQ